MNGQIQSIEDQSKENNAGDRNSTCGFWGGIIAPLLVCVIIWLSFGALPFFIVPRLSSEPLQLETAGQLGDSFGMANSLFSALALGGVVIAIILQQQSLAAQRKDIELTQKEMKESSTAQKKSQLELERQANFSHITTLLSTINAIISDAENVIQKKGDHQAVLRAQVKKQVGDRMRELLFLEMLKGTISAEVMERVRNRFETISKQLIVEEYTSRLVELIYATTQLPSGHIDHTTPIKPQLNKGKFAELHRSFAKLSAAIDDNITDTEDVTIWRVVRDEVANLINLEPVSNSTLDDLRKYSEKLNNIPSKIQEELRSLQVTL